MDNGNHKIKQVCIDTGAVTSIAGIGEEGDKDGVGTAARLRLPHGIAASPDGSSLFFTDFNHKVKRLDFLDVDDTNTDAPDADDATTDAPQSDHDDLGHKCCADESRQILTVNYCPSGGEASVGNITVEAAGMSVSSCSCSVDQTCPNGFLQTGQIVPNQPGSGAAQMAISVGAMASAFLLA